MTRLVCLALVSSCSWAVVKSPPVQPPPRGTYVACTSAYGAPAIDSIFATLFGLGAAVLVGLAAYNTEDGDQTTSLIVGGSAYGAAALGFGVSAAGGFRDTRTCRRLQSGN